MCGFVVCIGKCNRTEIYNATLKINYLGPDDTNYFFDDSFFKKKEVSNKELKLLKKNKPIIEKLIKMSNQS